jgi:LmbE family N-acetylglucosaminyl deacetylase
MARRGALGAALLLSLLSGDARETLGAAQRAPAAEGASLPEAVEAIQHARVATRILYVIAHPDDEGGSVGLLAYLSRGLGAEVAILSITRGEGGQNAIGPEYGGKLAILRSEELLAACRSYGIGLYFTRAADFGYSKTPEETMRIWGDAVVRDMKDVIGAFRPHIVINNWGGVRGGHGHHVAAGLLTTRVFEELQKGGAGWRPRVLLQPARGEAAAAWTAPSDQVSPLWGKTYNDFGVEGFIQHRTQGIVGFRTSPFFRSRRGVVRIAGAEFRPEMLAEPISSLGKAYPKHAAQLAEAEKQIDAAKDAALRLDWAGAALALARAGLAIDLALEDYGSTAEKMSCADRGDCPANAADAGWELLRIKRRIDAALEAATALRVVARAERGEVVASESFTVRAEWQSRSGIPLAVVAPEIGLPEDTWQATLEEKTERSARYTVKVPQDARARELRYGWMDPEPWPLVQAGVRVRVERYEFSARAPVAAQRVTSTRVDEVPLALVPAATIALEPRSVVLLARKMETGKGKTGDPIELLARVHYYGRDAAEIPVGLTVDETARREGWSVVPLVTLLKFEGPGDQLVRFSLLPSGEARAGSFSVSAWFGTKPIMAASLEPLPSLPTRLWSEPAVVPVRVVEMAVPENLRVGYIAAENDTIPAALRQIGVQVEMLDEVALAFGDLSRFDAIAVGIRAYELRPDLIRSNRRLLEYAAAGGTLVVQYQRDDDWNRLRPAPYPASVSQPTIRVSVEDSPVRLLAPAHPVVNFPNRITPADFEGWVQERGLYFWGTFDANYEPILGMRDPGEPENTGGLVYARHGKGVYIYTGLSFFRQLPEGVPGAFRLFVNLLSQGRAPKPAAAAKG